MSAECARQAVQVGAAEPGTAPEEEEAAPEKEKEFSEIKEGYESEKAKAELKKIEELSELKNKYSKLEMEKQSSENEAL